jgi:DNA-binding NarL/FixJ family response regulator
MAEFKDGKMIAMDKVHVLVMVNNPTELSAVFEMIRRIKVRPVVAEFAFNLSGTLQALSRFKPNYILIDDNIGRVELQHTVEHLAHHRKTKHVPITIIKNSNYLEAMNTGVMNYVLKHTLTPEALYKALVNSLKFKRTQMYLQRAYRKRKGQVIKLLKEGIR